MMKYDVIVCGAGPSGMSAAIAAKRNHANVMLIESSGLLGGANVLSLAGPWMTFHNNGVQVIKGIAGEFVEKLVERGHSCGHITDPIDFCDTITPVDIEGVEELYFDYIREESIGLLLHAMVCGVIQEDNTIKGVQVATKSGILDIYANVVIDATGDGDVCEMMGCEYVLGRTKDNLRQPMTMIFTIGNVDTNQIKEYMKKHPDDFVSKEGYEGDYLAVSGFFSKVEEARNNDEFDLPRDRVLIFEEVRKNQVSVNMTRVQNLSGIDAFELTKAEIEGRLQIKKAFQFLKKYIPGFANSYIVRTPSKIGIRETRHIMGEYLLQIEDILALRRFDDSICLSSFPVDIHAPSGEKLELFEQSKDKGYEIPIRVMLPKRINNLIVTGRCISATHEAAASLRVTPTAMALGQAAGVLGALSSKLKLSPKEVNYRLVQDQLLQEGQVIKRVSNVQHE
jgi:ribulose 1,5-bisphosphate synthetase/thiazole synthase